MAPEAEQASERALLDRIARRVGADEQAPLRQPAPSPGQPQQQLSPEEEEELHRQRLLERIARVDETDQEERERHERFLQAKEEAQRRGGKPAAEAIRSSGRREQTRIGSEIFDKDTGERLAAIGASAQNSAQHEEFLKAKEEADRLARQREEELNAKMLARQQEEWQAQQAEQPQEGSAKCLVPTWITEEEYREWGYPKIDPKFKDKEWHRQQMELDRTDPRHNPNLLRDTNDPEFWYHAARKPFSKALLRSEQHWDSRRKTWLKQYEKVQDMNNRREEIAELMEDCSTEIKRIVAPIMKYTITWTHLNNMLNRAVELKKTFRECVEEKENREMLEGLRHKIDIGGDQVADAMMKEYDVRFREVCSELAREKLEEDRKERRLADIQTLAQVMNWGTKCKKDGLIEWERGNWAEAHASWRQADEALQKFKAADSSENQMLMDLHIAVLKNLAQACIKLEYWTDAIDAADSAIKIDPDDHKAWFRKACALEGLGRIDDAEECLIKVDDCSVGRPDRKRITKDTQAKREKLQSIRERNSEVKTKMFGKALAQGIFSEDRQQAPLLDAKEEPAEPGKPKPLEPFQEATRKHLTRDAAEDLLMELTEAYKDSTFQMQIWKLAMDVKRDKREFLANLKRVALPLQKPVLLKFGFEPSERGVAEMTRAIQDFTRGKRADARVKARADETTQALYGCMYDILTLPGADELKGPPMEARVSTGARGKDDDSE